LHGGVSDIDQTRVDAISIAVPEPFQYGCQVPKCGAAFVNGRRDFAGYRLAGAQQRSNTVESMHSVP
jgi:hypothetical protein